MSNCFNPGTASTGTVTATGLTVGQTYLLMVDGNSGNVCNFTVSNWTATGILGMSLVDLSALALASGNEIRWTTLSESNNDYFVLQRSEDGINFENVATLDGAGTSSVEHSYSFNDDYRLSGVVYYRLKQVDFNGLSSYSEALSLDRNAIQDLSYYPNPAENQLHVNLKHTEPVTMTVCTINGQVVETYQFTQQGNESITVSLANYKQGMYILRFKGENTAFTDQKFIKK
jgi:hypothetical protein